MKKSIKGIPTTISAEVVVTAYFIRTTRRDERGISSFGREPEQWP
jgi:hypothetical protein